MTLRQLRRERLERLQSRLHVALAVVGRRQDEGQAHVAAGTFGHQVDGVLGAAQGDVDVGEETPQVGAHLRRRRLSERLERGERSFGVALLEQHLTAQHRDLGPRLREAPDQLLGLGLALQAQRAGRGRDAGLVVVGIRQGPRTQQPVGVEHPPLAAPHEPQLARRRRHRHQGHGALEVALRRGQQAHGHAGAPGIEEHGGVGVFALGQGSEDVGRLPGPAHLEVEGAEHRLLHLGHAAFLVERLEELDGAGEVVFLQQCVGLLAGLGKSRSALAGGRREARNRECQAQEGGESLHLDARSSHLQAPC